MCRPSSSTISVSASSSLSPSTTYKFDVKYIRYFAAVIIPLVFPPGGLVNEGFTRWWLRIAIACLILRNQDMCRFQAILGLSINVGWYAVSIIDYFAYGHQFGNILLRNVRGVRALTIANDLRADQLDLIDTPMAVSLRWVSLVLDLLLHPVLCYCFWRACWKSKLTLDQIATWRVMLGTFLLSRLWSATQNYARYGKFSVYYYGDHVYYLPPNSDHLWTIGYLGEAATLSCLTIFKLYKMRQRSLARRAAAAPVKSE
jgi:hypothetical protein